MFSVYDTDQREFESRKSLCFFAVTRQEAKRVWLIWLLTYGYVAQRKLEAFMVAYTDYLLIIEFVGLGALVVMWFRGLKRRTMSAHGDAPYRRAETHQPQKKQREKFFRRLTVTRRQMAPKPNLLKDQVTTNGAAIDVPIPWGWPHYQDYSGTRMEKPTLSDSMHSLMDCLTREKQLAREPFTDARITNSVRALLEDRYGRIDKSSTPVSITQNGSVSAVQTLHAARIPTVYFQDTGIKELRRPWGW